MIMIMTMIEDYAGDFGVFFIPHDLVSPLRRRRWVIMVIDNDWDVQYWEETVFFYRSLQYSTRIGPK